MKRERFFDEIHKGAEARLGQSAQGWASRRLDDPAGIKRGTFLGVALISMAIIGVKKLVAISHSRKAEKHERKNLPRV